MNLPVEHRVDKLKVVSDTMVQFPCHDGILGQKRVLRLDQPISIADVVLHSTDRQFHRGHAVRCPYRLGHNIGEASQEGDIMFIVIMLRRAVYFQHPVRRAIGGLDDHVHSGDDTMLAVEQRQDIARVMTQISTDHRLLGCEGTTLRHTRICDRDDLPNHPLVPACPGFDEQIIFAGTIAPDFAIWDIQTAGTDAGSLGKYIGQITFGERMRSECRECGLLPAESRDLLGRATVIARRRMAFN